MSAHRKAEIQRVAAQAAEWLVMLEDGSEKEHAALAEWLLESPLHTRMFLRAAAIDRQAAALHPQILEELLQPSDRRPASNVVPLSATGHAGKPSIHRKRWPLMASAAALAASLACVAIWHRTAGSGAWDRYITAVGEQHSISLKDGSLVSLNTHSEVDVRFSEHGRDIRLQNGEALFTVKHDAQRPFRVHVGDTVIQALGTQFNVYRQNHGVLVTVIEGSVKISQPGASRIQGPVLVAGQAARVENRQIETTEHADTAQALAWRQRQLVFQRASLQDIATEFNRYNRAPRLRIDERLAEEHRYTAVFDADNPQLLLRFLERDPLLRMVNSGEEIVVQPRQGS